MMTQDMNLIYVVVVTKFDFGRLIWAGNAAPECGKKKIKKKIIPLRFVAAYLGAM
jgi:hypothetical protein